MTLLDKPIPMPPAGLPLGSLASRGWQATQLVAERLIAAHAKPRRHGDTDIAGRRSAPGRAEAIKRAHRERLCLYETSRWV